MKREMILSFFLGSFLLFTAFNAIAQETGSTVKVDWGKEYTTPSKSYITEIIGTDGDYIYMIRNKDKRSLNTYSFISPSESKNMIVPYHKPSLEVYNMKGNFEINHNIPSILKEANMDLESFTLLNNELSIITSQYDKVKKNNSLHISTLDKKELKLNTPKKINSIPANTRYNKGGFKYSLSYNRKYLSTIQIAPSNLGGKKQGVDKIKVFDEQLNFLWEKEISEGLPNGNDEKYYSINYEVDNEGNVYHLVETFKSKEYKKNNRGKPNSAYTIIAYTNEGNSVSRYDISLDDLFMINLKFKISNTGKIICSGFYSTKNPSTIISIGKGHGINGIFYQVINLEKEENPIEIKTIKEFDADFLGEYRSDKKVAKGKGLPNFKLDDIIVRKDGSVVLLAEQYSIIHNMNYNKKAGDAGVTLSYEYQDIIVVNVSMNGEIEWITKIPKDQYTHSDSGFYSSYNYLINDGNIHLIYNDDPRNLDANLNNERTFRGKKRSVGIVATIASDGSISHSLISKNKEEKMIIRPKTCKQINANQMVIHANWKGKNRVGILTVE